MAGFNGDSGADADCGVRREFGGFQCKQVIAEVFTGVGDDRRAGGGVKEFNAEHEVMVKVGGRKRVKMVSPGGRLSRPGLSVKIRQRDL
jgi:hypothetical protein